MANLTLTIDDELLKRARIKALEQGTSVNAVVRDYLRGFAGEDPARAAILRVVSRARDATSGSAGRRWTREELHERAALR